MQYAEIVESIKELDESSLKEVAFFISFLKKKKNSKSFLNNDEAADIIRSYAGSLPSDFDENLEKSKYFNDKYGA